MDAYLRALEIRPVYGLLFPEITTRQWSMMQVQATTGKGILEPDFLRKLERLALIARRVQLGGAKGERKSKRKGISIEFADYRDYVQGDETRHIDWNIYSRLDSLYLKLFQEQEDLTLHLLIDASRSMGFGTPPKLQFACKLAAALGYIALVGYDRVCVEAFSGTSSQILAPVRGKASAGKLFSFLEAIRADGPTRLEPACRAHILKIRSPGIMVMISDFFDQEGFEGPLRRLAGTGSDLYAVQVLAPEEMDPEVSGDLKLVDSETGESVEVSVSRSLMAGYIAGREDYCESIRNYCVARGIGQFLTSSDTPVERVTLDILRKGGMVR